MAEVHLNIAGRVYVVSCRDGEEQQLHALAAMVDEQAQAVGSAMGSITETRQLLFASLFLADKLSEAQKQHPNGVQSTDSSAELSAKASNDDDSHAEILEKLAERIEAIADTLET